MRLECGKICWQKARSRWVVGQIPLSRCIELWRWLYKAVQSNRPWCTRVKAAPGWQVLSMTVRHRRCTTCSRLTYERTRYQKKEMMKVREIFSRQCVPSWRFTKAGRSPHSAILSGSFTTRATASRGVDPVPVRFTILILLMSSMGDTLHLVRKRITILRLWSISSCFARQRLRESTLCGGVIQWRPKVLHRSVSPQPHDWFTRYKNQLVAYIPIN